MCSKCNAERLELDQARGATLAEALDEAVDPRFTMTEGMAIVLRRHAGDPLTLARGITGAVAMLAKPHAAGRIDRAACDAVLERVADALSRNDGPGALRVLAEAIDGTAPEHVARVAAWRERAATLARVRVEN